MNVDTDGYSDESQFIADHMAEAESVSARKRGVCGQGVLVVALARFSTH